MAHYSNKIKIIYEPQGVVDADFSLEDTGGGTVIAFWNTAKLGVQPTIASLDSQISDSEIESCQRWKIIRNERDKLLKESDYLILADAPIDETQKQEWTTYRQALRDIPQDYDSPDEVVYPDKPE